MISSYSSPNAIWQPIPELSAVNFIFLHKFSNPWEFPIPPLTYILVIVISLISLTIQV